MTYGKEAWSSLSNYISTAHGLNDRVMDVLLYNGLRVMGGHISQS
jgi:hypothetical protein